MVRLLSKGIRKRERDSATQLSGKTNNEISQRGNINEWNPLWDDFEI